MGQVVDYMMLMTYDQYWSTSPTPGSVAQVTWVEKNIKKVLGIVPKEKLLLGIPFYTRLWKEEKSSDGRISAYSVKSLSMEEAKKLVKENNASVRWDEESGQFYCEYRSNGTTYKIWLEETNSINLKSSLVQKYGLAGVAAWKRSDAALEIWGVLQKNLKEIESYQVWLAENKSKAYVYD